MTGNQRPGAWYHHWLLPVVAFAFAWLIAAWCFRPPAPRGSDASEQVFSAARAQLVLKEAFGDEKPHPLGSPQNAAVRERLLAQLRKLGLSPNVQTAFACRGSGLCAHVQNIVALVEGSAEHDEALLLCAHYDSVAAGPGIGDDAAGTAAVIETVRAILAGPRPQHDIVVLLDDGEEAGLLGATAFMSKHPLAARIRAVVNIEARGSGGPSLMFESAGHADELMEVLATLDKPLTSSLFVDVYKRLPNDTDFTVFQRHGVAGFNLAYIRGVEHYHTPLDDIEHNSVASLQHHGDNALSLLRALDQYELNHFAAGGGRERVWFDWLGITVVNFSVDLARALAVGLLVAMLSMVAVWGWRPERRWSTMLKALLGLSVTLAIPALLMALVVEAAKAFKATDTPWLGHMTPYLVVLVAAAAAGVVSVGSWMRSARGWLIYALIWSQWAALGVVVAELLPAAAHLFVIPTGCAALCGVVGVFARREERTPWGRTLLILPVVVTVTLWGRIAIGFVQVAGLHLYPAVVLAFALPLTTMLPALASQPPRHAQRLIGGALILTAVAALLSLMLPPFTQSAPQRMSIMHLQSEQGPAHWLVDASWGELPEAMVAAGSLGPPGAPPLPMPGMRQVAMGPAPRVDGGAPRVELTVIEAAGPAVHVTFRVTSPRQSANIAIVVPQSVRLMSLRIAGRQIGWQALRSSALFKQHRVAAYLSMPPDGVDVEFTIEPNSGLEFEVLDIGYGLPAIAEPLVKARGLVAVPSQDGDLSIRSAAVALTGADLR